MSDSARIAVLAAALLVVGFPYDAASEPPTNAATSVPARTGCLAAHDGYLRARIRGAMVLDLDWKDADMQCAGGPRPAGQGIRVSIAGPLRSDGRRIRFVFGVHGIGEGAAGKAVPTNVTLVFEGERHIFSTQGEDKCTIDSLEQHRTETLGSGLAVYRVLARGFCVGPAAEVGGSERLLITSFDFAGRVEFDDDDRHEVKTANP